MWNFYQCSEHDELDLKYLVVINPKKRWKYEEMHKRTDLMDEWYGILEEYGDLERSSGITQQASKNTRLLLRRAKYTEELSMIKSLSLNPKSKDAKSFVLKLIKGGYKFKEYYTNLMDFYDDVKRASERVHHHVTFIHDMSNDFKVNDDDKKKNTDRFSEAMAWLMSNDVKADDNITVRAFLEVKKIINGRNKQERPNKP